MALFLRCLWRTNMKPLLRFYVAALTAYGIWGFFSLVLKPLHAYASVDILFYRVFLCAVIMAAIVLLFKRKVLKENVNLFKSLSAVQKRKVLWLNIGGGMLLTANWFSFIYVMNHINVKATSLAYLVCPILTTLLAWVILKEKLSKQQWLAIFLSIVGCVILSYSNLMDMVFSLIIGLSYALYLIAQRQNTGFDKLILLSSQFLCAALLLLPFYPIYSATLPTAFDFYFYISIIAIGFTIIPLFLNLYALKGLNSSTAGMLLNLNPLIAFALAFFVFREEISILQISAYVIIFAAVVVFNATSLFGRRQLRVVNA